MIGDTSFQPYSINTFSGKGKKFTTIGYNDNILQTRTGRRKSIHYVNPHNVRPYRRKDGTFVSGYWRDGDGDTSIDRATGYYSRNPISTIVKKGFGF